MDAQSKAKWLEALRSEKYQQAQGTLRDGDRFCCLGVLCDITKRGDWVSANSVYRPNVQRYDIGGHVSTMFLPMILRTEFDLIDDVLDPLMGMNDKGESFAMIADWIEANIEVSP